MRIGIAYASWERYGEVWNSSTGLIKEIESRGIEVIKYNLYADDGKLPPSKMRLYSDCWLVDFKRDYDAGKLDGFLILDYGQFHSKILNKINFSNIPMIMEAGDDPQAFSLNFRKSGNFHAVLTPDYQSVDRYDVDSYWWTHFADTRIFSPNSDIDIKFDCVTTCGPRGKVTEDIDGNLFSDEFNNERYFYGQDHADRLNMGKMVFQCSQYGEITRRLFEGMACGKMVICDRLNSFTNIDSLFTDKDSIIYYDDGNDAAVKIAYYSEHDEEREAIAKKGHDIVMKNHTQVNRVDEVLRVMEFCSDKLK